MEAIVVDTRAPLTIQKSNSMAQGHMKGETRARRPSRSSYGLLVAVLSLIFCSTHGFSPASVSTRRPSGLLEALIPEENPDFDPEATSSAGVRYADVLAGLHRLFPPSQLDQRNAMSRTDGYWPYIHKGEDPPQQLTYGEFDFYFFAQLLDRLSEDWSDQVFCDIGSGTGRLVLAAAALHPNLRQCRGIELLPKIHEQAEENLRQCANGLVIDQSKILHMAATEFVCGSLDDPYVYFGDAHIIFVFSSCMSSDILERLAAAIGRQCQPGTVVITTDYMLPLKGTAEPVPEDPRVSSGDFELELVEKVDGWCWLTGGASTAWIHRVKVSCWQPDAQPLRRPEPTAEDQAYQVAMALEKGELTDSQAFLR